MTDLLADGLPELWLTGLGSWAVSYLIHSTVILACVLLISHFAGFLSQSNKDVLLKIALVAGMLTASIQFMQSADGRLNNTIMVDITSDKSGTPALEVLPVRTMVTDNLQMIVPSQERITEGQPISSGLSFSWLQWLLQAWLAGIAFFALRFVWLWQRFKMKMGKRTPLDHEPTVELCQRLKQQMGVRQEVKITCSQQLISPMAIGLGEICIPDKLWEVVNEQELTAIVAHEMAHLVRIDPVWLFFWHLMSIVFFFQPLNKLTQLGFQSRAEFLADAIAVRQTKDPQGMVSSLINAARLLAAQRSGGMAPQLLGTNATLYERAQALLNENPIQTRTSLPVILLAAFITVGVSVVTLPSVSLARTQPGDGFVQWQPLNPGNSLSWTLPEDEALSHQTNIDYLNSVAGRQTGLKTRLVTFNAAINDVAAIEPGGRLHFVSRNLYGQHELQMEADTQGQIRYRYSVDGEVIDDVEAARAMIGEVLDDGLGASHEFKRKMLQLYIEPQPENGSMTAFTRVIDNLQRAMAVDVSGLDEVDLQTALAMIRHTRELEVLAATKPEVVAPPKAGNRFFVAMAYSGPYVATFNDFGLLSISAKGKGSMLPKAQYDFNNGVLINAWLAAKNEFYLSKITDKQLLEFLVRLHFAASGEPVQWLHQTE